MAAAAMDRLDLGWQITPTRRRISGAITGRQIAPCSMACCRHNAGQQRRPCLR